MSPMTAIIAARGLRRGVHAPAGAINTVIAAAGRRHPAEWQAEPYCSAGGRAEGKRAQPVWNRGIAWPPRALIGCHIHRQAQICIAPFCIQVYAIQQDQWTMASSFYSRDVTEERSDEKPHRKDHCFSKTRGRRAPISILAAIPGRHIPAGATRCAKGRGGGTPGVAGRPSAKALGRLQEKRPSPGHFLSQRHRLDPVRRDRSLNSTPCAARLRGHRRPLRRTTHATEAGSPISRRLNAEDSPLRRTIEAYAQWNQQFHTRL